MLVFWVVTPFNVSEEHTDSIFGNESSGGSVKSVEFLDQSVVVDLLRTVLRGVKDLYS
jgi:hypothetical protein